MNVPAKQCGEVYKRVSEEVKVLEETQDSQIGNDTEHQKASALVSRGSPANVSTAVEVDNGGEEQQAAEFPVPERVEEVAREQ